MLPCVGPSLGYPVVTVGMVLLEESGHNINIDGAKGGAPLLGHWAPTSAMIAGGSIALR